jgi:hypothetical protein
VAKEVLREIHRHAPCDLVQLERDKHQLAFALDLKHQTTLLTNQRTAVNLRMQQMTASVELIKALGGGWNSSQLPTPRELTGKTP